MLLYLQQFLLLLLELLRLPFLITPEEICQRITCQIVSDKPQSIVKIKKLPLILSSLLLSAALPAVGQSYIENFTGFSNSLTSGQTGGDEGQIIADSIGANSSASSGSVPAIDGTSLFLTIDTTSAANSFGGFIRTTIQPGFSAGDLTSSDAADYNIVFDLQANGFTPVNVDVFLNFRDSTNTNVFGQISINQGNAAFSVFVNQLNTNNTVSVSLPLSEFSGLPANVSGLASADRFSYQINSRSPLANYSAGNANVLVIDNVGIVAVPEPSSVALLGLAAAGVAIFARRRNRGA